MPYNHFAISKLLEYTASSNAFKFESVDFGYPCGLSEINFVNADSRFFGSGSFELCVSIIDSKSVCSELVTPPFLFVYLSLFILGLIFSPNLTKSLYIPVTESLFNLRPVIGLISLFFFHFEYNSFVISTFIIIILI